MKKLYGPYFRKDGRQHLVVVDGDKKTSLSYPKFLLQNLLGRELLPGETTDHKDGDFTNNSPGNLQILSIEKNSAKYFDDNPNKRRTMITLTCSYCGRFFQRDAKDLRRKEKVGKHKEVFCSRRCQGKVFH